MSYFRFITAALALLAGCSPSHNPRIAASRPLTAAETRVVEIARQAVATNETWVDRAEFHLPHQAPDGTWVVIVWRLPEHGGAIPAGANTTIWIDTNGHVIRYVLGQ